TGAMVLLGKTFGNLMVDLRATNTKLLYRSRRIVATLTGLPADEAEALLARCGGEVKTAIVAHHRKIDAQQAQQILDEAGGHLRHALGDAARMAMALLSPSVADTAMRGSEDPTHDGSDLILGIDGGGSKTIVWLARRGDPPTILGRGRAGASNPRVLGIEAAARNLESALQAAWTDAQLEPRTVAAASLAMAG